MLRNARAGTDDTLCITFISQEAENELQGSSMKSVQEWVRNFVRRHPGWFDFWFVFLLILLSWPVWEGAQEGGTYFSQKAQARDLEQARNSWDERPFTRYRFMVDTLASPFLPLFNRGSQKIIEVDSEQVLDCQQIFEKQIIETCKSPVTITNLFDSIETAIV